MNPIQRFKVSEYEKLRRDAERYRWLRDKAPEAWEVTQYVTTDLQACHLASASLDAAIDAAMNGANV